MPDDRDAWPQPLTRQEIADRTPSGYSAGAGHFKNSVSSTTRPAPASTPSKTNVTQRELREFNRAREIALGYIRMTKAAAAGKATNS